jgi:hypothetical protein
MSYFLKLGNKFTVTPKDAMDLHEKLPTGNYTAKFNTITQQYYLEAVDNFTHDGKIYGETNKHIERIINTFSLRKNSTGLLLTGEKGSGKTLLAKLLSIELAKLDIPTIIINEPHCGEEFNNFMQSIEQPIIILFDEFEKTYNHKEQEQILTLLDGVYPTKKLFILTCNNRYALNEYLNNRPGRIFYNIEYRGLSKEFIEQYCTDNLLNKAHINSITQLTSIFSQFNFDMLKALVEEMNRYNESPHEALEMLNISPIHSDKIKYSVHLKIMENGILSEVTADKQWKGNPLLERVSIDFTDKDTLEDCECVFLPTDLKSMTNNNNNLLFIDEEGNELTLTKNEPKQVNYWDLLAV